MAPRRSAPRGSYAKSADTRRAILDAAIPAFAEHGPEGASTRGIATAAGVNQPALNYHFGSKDGLYRQCAEAIVDRFALSMGESTAPAVEFLAAGGSDAARAHALLNGVMHGLVDTL
ncbi:MAG: TetR family transcriptional regulator, partial [Pseudomonadota bacterium]|nr:TetR family transcriptional regulator [Pseudomonadota bacterium]